MQWNRIVMAAVLAATFVPTSHAFSQDVIRTFAGGQTNDLEGLVAVSGADDLRTIGVRRVNGNQYVEVRLTTAWGEQPYSALIPAGMEVTSIEILEEYPAQIAFAVLVSTPNGNKVLGYRFHYASGPPILAYLGEVDTRTNGGNATLRSGNLNGDAYPDLVVFAGNHDEPGMRACGAVEILFGSPSFTFTPGAMVTGDRAGERRGSCGAVGDINPFRPNDEIVAGSSAQNLKILSAIGITLRWIWGTSPGYGDGGVAIDEANALVYTGSPGVETRGQVDCIEIEWINNRNITRWSVHGAAQEWMGQVVTLFSSTLSSTLDRLAVSSQLPDQRGRVTVLDAGTGSELFHVDGDAAGNWLGLGIAAGDVNFDGSADLVVAEPGADIGSIQNAGRLWWLSTRELSLVAQPYSVSLTAAAQHMELDAGPQHADQAYTVLGSMSGIRPGFPLGPVHVPLELDAYTLFSAGLPTALVAGGVGTLDASGRASARFQLPGNLADPELAGRAVAHAFVVLGPNGPMFASNAASLLFEP